MQIWAWLSDGWIPRQTKTGWFTPGFGASEMNIELYIGVQMAMISFPDTHVFLSELLKFQVWCGFYAIFN